MDKKDIIDFFDRHAASWDAELIRNDAVINTILDNGGIHSGVKVLDVACGTGVLIPDYLARGVGSVTGIDISPEMIAIAKGKFKQDNVCFICDDVETAELGSDYDCCIVYNAFPHFPEPERLIRVLALRLKHGGRLSIAHGMSREKIDRHHEGSASKVSMGLMSETKLKKLMDPYFDVDVLISDDNMYQVSGTKK